MNPILLSEKQRLDSLFDRVSKLPVDEEFHAHWSRYLCVLISGFIENAMRILLTEYSKNKSHPNVSNYVSKQIKGITNATSKFPATPYFFMNISYITNKETPMSVSTK